MDDSAAKQQIDQMVEFILQEAREKASELEIKTEEEYNLQKTQFLENAKAQMRKEYENKQQQALMKRTIARSTEINQARLEKMRARDKIMNQIRNDGLSKLATFAKSPKYPQLLAALIIEGLYRMNEKEVSVRYRPEDKDIVSGILADCAAIYKAKTEKAVSLKLDTTTQLASGPTAGSAANACAGGVVLVCNHGKILLDNTLDTRFDIAFEDLKPEASLNLFGTRAKISQKQQASPEKKHG